MSKSFFESACDKAHAVLAQLTIDQTRAAAPYYRYGAAFFEGDEGHTPRVRYRPDATFRLVDNQGPTDMHSFMWEQRVVCQVWGADENETMDETGRILAAHRLAGAAYFGDVEGTWINQDGHDVGAQGFMVEVPITMRCVPGTLDPSTPAYVHRIDTQVSGSFDTDPLTEDGALWHDMILTGSST